MPKARVSSPAFLRIAPLGHDKPGPVQSAGRLQPSNLGRASVPSAARPGVLRPPGLDLIPGVRAQPSGAPAETEPDPMRHHVRLSSSLMKRMANAQRSMAGLHHHLLAKKEPSAPAASGNRSS